MNFYNPYIVIPFITWVCAQLVKFGLAAWQNRFDLRYLYASGGMPSAHSAVVCSLAVTALLRSGVNSAIFGLSAVFAAIVMYDSFGVRRAAGEQAAAINAIVEMLSRQRGQADLPGHLRQILGHKPLEVTVGALFGLAAGLIFNANYLSSQGDWLVSFPGQKEALFYLGAALALLVIWAIGTVWLKRRYRDSGVVAGLRRNLTIKDLTIGLAGIVLAVAAYEKALYLGWRLWVYLLLVIFLVWVVALLAYYWQRLPESLDVEKNQARVRQWLPRKRNRRRKG